MTKNKDGEGRNAAKSGEDRALPKVALPRAIIINGKTWISCTQEEMANWKKLIEQEDPALDDPRTWSNAEVAEYIRFVLGADTDSQSDFVTTLRDLHNDITDLFADLLDPSVPSDLRLILKFTKRGRRFSNKLPDWVFKLIEDGVLERADGKRIAIKPLARQYKVSPAALRSFLRRMGGTHTKRRKQGGRK